MYNIKNGIFVYDSVDKCKVKILRRFYGQFDQAGPAYVVMCCGRGGCKKYVRAGADLRELPPLFLYSDKAISSLLDLLERGYEVSYINRYRIKIGNVECSVDNEEGSIDKYTNPSSITWESEEARMEFVRGLKRLGKLPTSIQDRTD